MYEPLFYREVYIWILLCNQTDIDTIIVSTDTHGVVFTGTHNVVSTDTHGVVFTDTHNIVSTYTHNIVIYGLILSNFSKRNDI